MKSPLFFFSSLLAACNLPTTCTKKFSVTVWNFTKSKVPTSHTLPKSSRPYTQIRFSLKYPLSSHLKKSLFSPKMSPGGECVPHPCGSLHASQAAVMCNSSQAIWEQLELTAQGGWWSLALAVMGGMGGGLTTDNSLWYQDQILKNLRGKASYTNMQGEEKVEEQGMNKRMEKFIMENVCPNIRTLHPTGCQATESGWRRGIIIDVDFWVYLRLRYNLWDASNAYSSMWSAKIESHLHSSISGGGSGSVIISLIRARVT